VIKDEKKSIEGNQFLHPSLPPSPHGVKYAESSFNSCGITTSGEKKRKKR